MKFIFQFFLLWLSATWVYAEGGGVCSPHQVKSFYQKSHQDDLQALNFLINVEKAPPQKISEAIKQFKNTYGDYPRLTDQYQYGLYSQDRLMRVDDSGDWVVRMADGQVAAGKDFSKRYTLEKTIIQDAQFNPKAKSELQKFPEEVRKKIGKAIFELQQGKKLEMPLSKPMPSVGSGVEEIRVSGRNGIYRVFYYTKGMDSVVILHSFMKKTQQTPSQDIEIGKNRLWEVLNEKGQ